jgi:hypothetical protein
MIAREATAKIVPRRSRRKENVRSGNLQEFFAGTEYSTYYGCVILDTVLHPFGYCGFVVQTRLTLLTSEDQQHQ